MLHEGLTVEGAAMTTDSADHRPNHEPSGLGSIDELIRQQGVPAVRTIDDLASDDVFDTDDEVDEFLIFVAEERNASLI
jgi:hypothetical protein